MTTLQKTIIVLIGIAALVTALIGLYQARVITNLREQVQAAKQQQEQQATLKEQVKELERERDRATNALAALSAKDVEQKKNPNEVLKLRGEVGRLRKENTEIGSKSALSKVTANPESKKMLRDQQKVAMTMVYKDFAQRAKLTPEQSEKLNDLLADHIMDNVGNVTTALRDKPTPEQLNELFAAQETVMAEKVGELLGQEGLAQYQDYTKDILSTVTAEQFKGMLTGTDEAKAGKSKQFAAVLQEETQAALTAAGLPADYQTVPMLNFRNIASEQEGDRSLKLLEDIYQRAAGRAGAFLSPDELAKFEEFKAAAVRNNRAALTLNRTMMAPNSP